MLNYTKLMAHKPTVYGEMVNSLGQTVVFAEHPLRGDEHPVICICHELELAGTSTFFETEEMEDEVYEPTFVDGRLLIGGSIED